MSPKQKKVLYRIIVSAVLFFSLLVLFKTVLSEYEGGRIEAVLFIVPYLIVGYDILIKAGKNIAHGQVFDENFLMIIAGIGAYATGEFEEAVAVMLFFQVGELFQSYAVGKSRQSIADLMDIAPETANLVAEDGSIEEADPEDVEIGSLLLVRPGEKVPLDGIVEDGESWLDTSALTGESVLRHIGPGEELFSGCINKEGAIKYRTTKAYEDSTVARILELVENAGSRKSRTENFITRFAKYYTPIVTIAAVLLAVIPSLITGDWAEWVKRACTFLVISCPCALVISVPMGFFGGIGAASKNGVLVKGSNFVEVFSRANAIAFDKTGTLTKGTFEVTKTVADDCTQHELIETAARAEAFSTHPIARSIVREYLKRAGEGCKAPEGLEDYTEISGCGVSGKLNGKTVLAGNAKLLEDNGISAPAVRETGTVVYIAADGKYIGYVIISDVIKEGMEDTIRGLKKAGIERTVMLTGDREETASAVAGSLGIAEYRAELLPADKVSAVEKLLDETNGHGALIFVGDGINDAPVLTRADIGVAMGALGSDAAIEAADVVIMDDDIAKLITFKGIARKTMRIVRQNIVFALGVKFAVLILGALGIANMWLAVFADVGVAVIAILNSMRALRTK
ncbi:MAG: heavy metal translocating P-type ATPase [Lachnospiraceae bacterium]|nr:heavy metal translocating P-type ATPase [Lachnospiraceae bacterium]